METGSRVCAEGVSCEWRTFSYPLPQPFLSTPFNTSRPCTGDVRSRNTAPPHFFATPSLPPGICRPLKKRRIDAERREAGRRLFFRPFCDGDTFLRIFQRDAGPTLRFSPDRFSAYVADPFVVLGYFSSGFKVTDLRKKRANERTVYWLHVGLAKFVTKIAEGWSG